MRRGAIAIVVVAGLAALCFAGRRHADRNQSRAVALLRWADVCQRVVPHTGRLVTTLFLGASPITTEVRITRVSPGHSRIEYLSPPLKGVCAIEEGDHIWRYDPSRRVVYADEQAPAPAAHPAQALALLLRNYRPVVTGSALVAGRPAVRLELDDRRSRRRARVFWVDIVKGLILRREEYRHDGALSVRTFYRQIQFAPPEPLWPEMPLPSVRVVHHPVALRVSPPAAALRPRYVPEGYEYLGAVGSQCGCSCGSPVVNLRYFDGLRMISVFRCQHSQSAPAGGSESVLLPNGSLVRLVRGAVTIFVVGEADPKELRRMAESLP